METDIFLQQELEQATHPYSVAFTETGKILEPEDGLRRFLMQTRDLIELDKQHFTEELFSDIFALYETGEILVEAAHANTDTLEEEPAMSSLAVASTVAAFYLLYSINAQRGAKEHEFRKALKMFVEFEEDCRDLKNGFTKEDRKFIAIENLRQKMQHSGLQFVNLPDEQHRFHKSEFREIAKKKGIGEPLSLDRVKKVREFFQQPFPEKVVMTGQALSYLMFQGERAVGFMGKIATEYIRNPIPNTQSRTKCCYGIQRSLKAEC